jgi:Crp-like helix-turn-helix protein
MTGQVEDGQVGPQTSGTPGQLESVQAGHLQIGHKGVHGVAVSEDCKRLAAITRSGDGVTQIGEKSRIDGEQEQIVVNEEDGGLHGTSRTADQAGHMHPSAVQRFHQQVAQTAACNGAHTVDQRCARWLLLARHRIGSDDLPLTQEFLSMMLALRRAGVTMAAGALQQAGLIRYRHGHITVLDANGLEEVSCECFRLIKDQEAELLH